MEAKAQVQAAATTKMAVIASDVLADDAVKFLRMIADKLEKKIKNES